MKKWEPYIIYYDEGEGNSLYVMRSKRHKLNSCAAALPILAAQDDYGLGRALTLDDVEEVSLYPVGGLNEDGEPWIFAGGIGYRVRRGVTG